MTEAQVKTQSLFWMYLGPFTHVHFVYECMRIHFYDQLHLCTQYKHQVAVKGQPGRALVKGSFMPDRGPTWPGLASCTYSLYSGLSPHVL